MLYITLIVAALIVGFVLMVRKGMNFQSKINFLEQSFQKNLTLASTSGKNAEWVIESVTAEYGKFYGWDESAIYSFAVSKIDGVYRHGRKSNDAQMELVLRGMKDFVKDILFLEIDNKYGSNAQSIPPMNVSPSIWQKIMPQSKAAWEKRLDKRREAESLVERAFNN